MSDSYLAFSYHYETDFEFVCLLAKELVDRGVPSWYLDKLEKPAGVKMEDYLGGTFDWRKEPQNWHATFLDQLCRSAGIIVLLSETADVSRHTIGHGMWRERAAIEYFLADNPIRVREVPRQGDSPGAALVDELVQWGNQVLALPPVLRGAVSDPNAFNTSTGVSGPGQLPEIKTGPTAWYELVRRDLYDVQWHCRRCGLQSDPYAFSREVPPARCPRCDFADRPVPGGAAARIDPC